MPEPVSLAREPEDALHATAAGVPAAAAAVGMNYLDPDLGERRRALLADLVRTGMQGERRGAHRMASRSHRSAEPDAASDAELRDRVRSRLGRAASHPGAIRVDVDQGVVRLSGRVLAKERDALLAQVRQVPGVRQLENAMSAHDHPREILGRDMPVSLPLASR
jgi:hypothetical protein